MHTELGKENYESSQSSFCEEAVARSPIEGSGGENGIGAPEREAAYALLMLASQIPTVRHDKRKSRQPLKSVTLDMKLIREEPKSKERLKSDTAEIEVRPEESKPKGPLELETPAMEVNLDDSKSKKPLKSVSLGIERTGRDSEKKSLMHDYPTFVSMYTSSKNEEPDNLNPRALGARILKQTQPDNQSWTLRAQASRGRGRGGRGSGRGPGRPRGSTNRGGKRGLFRDLPPVPLFPLEKPEGSRFIPDLTDDMSWDDRIAAMTRSIQEMRDYYLTIMAKLAEIEQRLKELHKRKQKRERKHKKAKKDEHFESKPRDYESEDDS